jgi:PAS domain S-box-containing protein
MPSAPGSNRDFSLLESVPDAMVICGGDGRIIYVNGVAEGLFGWARQEIVGQPVEVLLPARLHGQPPFHQATYRASPTSQPIYLGDDLFGLRKGGGEFAAEISLSPLQIGPDCFAIAAVRDVSGRKRLERRAELYREAKEEARERDEFLSMASHELRTPVTALQLQLQLLQRAAARWESGLAEGLLAKVNVIERQCRRIAALVDELLDVSRLHLGRMELRCEEIDLAELATRTVVRLEAAGPRSSSIIQVVAEPGATGCWDRARLEQVVAKLLSNAIKFGRSKPILVHVRADPEHVWLEVRDQGIGIEPADQERIFGRFERAVPTHHFGGLGLGLYIAREIVEAHGGIIGLESAPGVGTTFTVELPRTPPTPEPQPQTHDARS